VQADVLLQRYMSPSHALDPRRRPPERIARSWRAPASPGGACPASASGGRASASAGAGHRVKRTVLCGTGVERWGPGVSSAV